MKVPEDIRHFHSHQSNHPNLYSVQETPALLLSHLVFSVVLLLFSLSGFQRLLPQRLQQQPHSQPLCSEYFFRLQMLLFLQPLFLTLSYDFYLYSEQDFQNKMYLITLRKVLFLYSAASLDLVFLKPVLPELQIKQGKMELGQSHKVSSLSFQVP